MSNLTRQEKAILCRNLGNLDAAISKALYATTDAVDYSKFIEVEYIDPVFDRELSKELLRIQKELKEMTGMIYSKLYDTVEH